jgi:hypothetical protein
MTDIFEDGFQVTLGQGGFPSPDECAAIVWGRDANADANAGTTTAHARPYIYLRHRATAERIDVTPLTDDPQSRVYKVTGTNRGDVQRVAMFVAERTGGTVDT